MVLTKGLLIDYSNAEREIEETQRKIDYYSKVMAKSEHGVVQGSMKDYPFAPTHFVLSGSDIKSDESRQEKLKQLLITLMERKKHYEDVEFDVAIAIENINDADMRYILGKKFIDKWTDAEIASDMHYDRTTITRKINTFFKNQATLSDAH